MPIAQHLEDRIAARVAESRTPGVALALIQDGALVHAAGYGVTSIEAGGQPVTPETLFQIGSTTKPLTGTLVMRLVEEGVLDLDRPVVAWLPELRLSRPGAAEQVTLRMLLSHTAGLPWDQITPHRRFGRRDPQALADWARDELPGRPLVASPGERFSYSNPGISLAARVAEAAAGELYADLMQRLVFEPLAMRRTTFDPTVAMTWPLAQSHALDADGDLRVEHRFADNAACYPAAFAYSTALELANFALMHLHAGRFGDAPVLAPESVAPMHAPFVSRGDEAGGWYGLTLRVDDWRGRRRVGHPGGISNLGCAFSLVPDHGAGVVVQYNHGGFAEVAFGLADELLAGLLGLADD
jgi:CubicO group peptidase (beta-lactamase class C family)